MRALRDTSIVGNIGPTDYGRSFGLGIQISEVVIHVPIVSQGDILMEYCACFIEDLPAGMKDTNMVIGGLPILIHTQVISQDGFIDEETNVVR